LEKRIVVATHGRFSEGILTSMHIIFGDEIPAECIAAYMDKGVDYQELFRKTVAENDYSTMELIVLTDILGGSVNNEFMKLLDEYPFHLVCGLNLGLLLEVAACPGDEVASQLPKIVERAREGILVCDDLARQAAGADEDNDF
jgi:fructoselysine and glucoselysine-specific PTS system IIA component